MKSVHPYSPKRYCFYCNTYLTEPLRDGLEPLASCRTVDHVIPRAKGGRDVRKNRVTSCYRCNQRKRDTLPDAKILKRLGLAKDARVRAHVEAALQATNLVDQTHVTQDYALEYVGDVEVPAIYYAHPSEVDDLVRRGVVLPISGDLS